MTNPRDLVLRALGSAISPRGRHAKLQILLYHRVLAEPDPMLLGEVDAATFERQMKWLHTNWRVLPLRQAIHRQAAGTLPARATAITFDDGYRDNVEVALPILQRLGLHATFFIATGFIDGGRMWNDSIIEFVRRLPGRELQLPWADGPPLPVKTESDRREAARNIVLSLRRLPGSQRTERVQQLLEVHPVELPTNLMMRSEQVRELAAAGMELGAHTINHPILSRISADDARHEVATSGEHLRQITGEWPSLFAYPNGKPGVDYTDEHVKLVREAGYEAAVSTHLGSASRNASKYELPRISPWQRSSAAFQLGLTRNLLRHRSDSPLERSN